MISVIITAFKEPKTIGRSVETFAKQLAGKDELLVIAPDRETLAEAEKHKKSILLSELYRIRAKENQQR